MRNEVSILTARIAKAKRRIARMTDAEKGTQELPGLEYIYEVNTVARLTARLTELQSVAELQSAK